MSPRHFIPLLLCASLCVGVSAANEKEKKPYKGDDAPGARIEDALRSKQYVHRTILNTVIENTSGFSKGSFYVNHLMGFSSVWQRGVQYSKYSSGSQGVSVGYVSKSGHGLEVGIEFSNVSSVFGGYRYFIQPKDFSVWPFIGFGLGHELSGVRFSEGPPESEYYTGKREMIFANLGILIPLVDIGLKAELRFNFYGTDRIVFTQGIGAILFL